MDRHDSGAAAFIFAFIFIYFFVIFPGGKRKGVRPEGRGGDTSDGSPGERASVHHLLRALHRGETTRLISPLDSHTGAENRRLCSVSTQAVILNCAHSFCCYCIKQWRKKKDECPICRQAILSQTRCLALDNCINSMVDNLSLDMKARRQTLIAERKGERCVKYDLSSLK